MDDGAFRKLLLNYYKKHGRHDMAWRHTDDPYAILVSEIMLQQTQVPRVTPKFRTFLTVFPTFRALAKAKTAKVLAAWQGLGYNRRALALHRCAQEVVVKHGGVLPDNFDALCDLPGIGPYTAGAVLAFAFNKPQPVIETNIRRVILHHYFSDQKNIGDDLILPIVERTLDRKNPRRWYWAYMDYGSFLGAQSKSIGNANKRSKHYARQSRFEGSLRQLRGRILKHLLAQGSSSGKQVADAMQDVRTNDVLTTLKEEGFLLRSRGRFICR